MIKMSAEDRKLMQEVIPWSCSDQELERRWDATVKVMEEKGVDYLVVAQRSDYLGQYVKWFTDMPTWDEYGATVIFSKDKEIVTIYSGGGFDEEQQPWRPANVFPESYCCRNVIRRWSRGYFPSLNYTAAYDAEIVVHELKDIGRIKVGIVGTAYMTVQCYEHLKANLTNAEIVDFTDEIDLLKAIKSPEELEMIRECIKIQDDILFAMRDFIKPGMKEMDIYAEMRYIAHKRGAENGIFLVGSNSYGKPAPFYNEHFHSNRVIQKGDTIALLTENNCANGMYGHVSGVYSLGDPSPALVENMKLCALADDFIRERLVDGGDCNDIFDEYNKFLASVGRLPETRLLGHGQGYDLVERPAMLPGRGETIKLAAAMNFSYHCTIATPEAWAIACANYFITKNGPPELINTFPTREIQIIG
ncbi:MAG: aminopeptidase P family protein [Peptococcaceae bacterium]|nr:aminopeptidase P family protein [Peptococcaceae bacterium]